MLNIGDKFGGGIIFHVFDGGETALVAAVEDQVSEPGMAFGNFVVTNIIDEWTSSGYTVLTQADGIVLGTGKANTDKIVAALAADGDHPSCARVCDELVLNGFDDWYLPSIDELVLMIQRKNVVSGFYDNKYYYSSSEGVPRPLFPNQWFPYLSSVNAPSAALGSSSSNKYLVRAIRTAHKDDPIGPIKPAKPNLLINTDYDQYRSYPSGLDNTVEFKLDDGAWITYSNGAITYQMLNGNHTLLIRYPAEGINPPSDPMVLTYTELVIIPPVDPVDPIDPGTPQEPGTDDGLGFSISKLVEHFKQYAINLKDIAHVPGNRRNEAFFHLELEALQDALTNGIKFPALYLQTPEVTKENAYDSITEAFSFTYVIVVSGRKAKADLLQDAKNIADKVFNRLNLDIQNQTIPCSMDGSEEGPFGPVGDQLYGWAVSITLMAGFDGVVAPADWEDLS